MRRPREKAEDTEQDKVARRKLIDRLLPTNDLGPLLGFLATTYDLNAEFFETDFLPTLLGLGAWDDRSWTSRIAIENKLADLEAGVVLVDAHRYNGRPRSLRIEVHPVLVGHGAALHAKLLLLVHSDGVRLQVASANLTEQGYRKNREVAAALSASAKDPSQARTIRDAVTQLRDAFGKLPESARLVTSLALNCLDPLLVNSSTPRTWFHVSGPTNTLWREVVEHLPAGEAIRRITVVSPFWSEEAQANPPFATMLTELSARSQLAPNASLRLLTCAKPIGGGRHEPILPASFGEADLGKYGVTATAHAVDPSVAASEIDADVAGLTRQLHAKVVLLESETTAVAYLGSANFSRHGWGFLPIALARNIEAGVVLLREGVACEALRRLIPALTGEPVPLAGAATGHLALPEPDEALRPWPDFLQEVRINQSAPGSDTAVLEVVFEPAAIAGDWTLSLPSGEEPGERLTGGSRSSSLPFVVQLDPLLFGQLFIAQEVVVQWWGSATPRRFPLNVTLAAREQLPVVPGIGKPGESQLLAYYQGQIALEDLYPPPPGQGEWGDNSSIASDASTVDTTRIQSYQIREFVEALKGIRDDLSKAATRTPAGMRAALLGPVSPIALAREVRDAVVAKRRSALAAAFQYVEILCCLFDARSYPGATANGARWKEIVEQAILKVEALLSELRTNDQALAAGGDEFAIYEAQLRRHYGAEARSRR